MLKLFGWLLAMEDPDEQNEFVTEQVQEIVKKQIAGVLNVTGLTYTKEKVNTWCTQIVDGILKSLAGLGKPFKYTVTCVIMQKNGSPLHTAASCFWDVKTDAILSMQVTAGKDAELPEPKNQLDTMDCIVTVFACMIGQASSAPQ